jgi:hypothetical protein
MKAKSLLRHKLVTEEGDIEEHVVWAVPKSLLFPEGVKYRLAFIPRSTRMAAVLFDNHHPKGHHRHWEGHEEPYEFVNLHQLKNDFEREVARWKKLRRPS